MNEKMKKRNNKTNKIVACKPRRKSLMGEGRNTRLAVKEQSIDSRADS